MQINYLTKINAQHILIQEHENINNILQLKHAYVGQLAVRIENNFKIRLNFCMKISIFSDLSTQ